MFVCSAGHELNNYTPLSSLQVAAVLVLATVMEGVGLLSFSIVKKNATYLIYLQFLLPLLAMNAAFAGRIEK